MTGVSDFAGAAAEPPADSASVDLPRAGATSMTCGAGADAAGAWRTMLGMSLTMTFGVSLTTAAGASLTTLGAWTSRLGVTAGAELFSGASFFGASTAGASTPAEPPPREVSTGTSGTSTSGAVSFDPRAGAASVSLDGAWVARGPR